MMKGCFADGAFNFEGEHYTITGYDGLPKPLQAATRRSSSAAAASGCCRSRPARPTSSASTRRCTAAQVGRGRRPERRRRRDRPEDRLGARTRPATGSTTSRSTCSVRRDRHRRPRGHGRDAGAAVRPPAGGARDLPPRVHRLGRRDLRGRSSAAGALGRLVLRRSRATRWRRWLRWSPLRWRVRDRALDLAFAGAGRIAASTGCALQRRA